MSFWGSIRKAIGDIGDVAKVALPIASFIPGVNLGVGALAGLGALSGAAGTLNDEGGTNLGKALGQGALYGGTNALAGKAIGVGAPGGGPANAGDALHNLLTNGGKAVNYFTDPEKGLQRVALAKGVGDTVLGTMAGRAEGAEQDAERRAREERMREFIRQLDAQTGLTGGAV